MPRTKKKIELSSVKDFPPVEAVWSFTDRNRKISGFRSSTKLKPHPLESILSKEKLENLYLKQKKSANDIAEKYNTTKVAVSFLIRKYGIKMRSRSEAQMLAVEKGKFKKRNGRKSSVVNVLTKEKLVNLYYGQEKTVKEIAGEYHCSPQMIHILLNKYDIKRK